MYSTCVFLPVGSVVDRYNACQYMVIDVVPSWNRENEKPWDREFIELLTP